MQDRKVRYYSRHLIVKYYVPYCNGVKSESESESEFEETFQINQEIIGAAFRVGTLVTIDLV